MLAKLLTISCLFTVTGSHVIAADTDLCGKELENSKAVYLCEFNALPIEKKPINSGERRFISKGSLCISKSSDQNIPYLARTVLTETTVTEEGNSFSQEIPNIFLVETDAGGKVKESSHSLRLEIKPRCISLITEVKMTLQLNLTDLSGNIALRYFPSGWCQGHAYGELKTSFVCQRK